MSFFSEVEKGFDLRFRKWTNKLFGANQSDDLVLLRRAILDEIESKIQTVRRGERMFPYNRVHIRLMSSDSSRRVLLMAAFGGGRLETDVREYLSGIGCDTPTGLSLDVDTVEAGGRQFEISYEVWNPPASPMVQAPAALEVIAGKADRESFLIEAPNTNLGRLSEVTDQREHIVRRNDIVLNEGADPLNSTVSRAHGHISFNAETGEYRIYDDNSEHGTRIIRNGRSINVPAGSRGERLKPGDEIYLGRVGLRFQ
jgi:hypothetical protein